MDGLTQSGTETVCAHSQTQDEVTHADAGLLAEWGPPDVVDIDPGETSVETYPGGDVVINHTSRATLVWDADGQNEVRLDVEAPPWRLAKLLEVLGVA